MTTNQLLLVTTLAISTGIEGCSKFESEEKQPLVCGVSDPVNELSWLKKQLQMIKNNSESGIILYTYNSKEVIEIQSSQMSSTNLSQYYCDGSKLEFDTPETYKKDYKDFLSKRVKIRILYGVDLWRL
ncbi:MAG: hypothetical protein ACKO1F_14605 [Flammeovirgaceae bacterium]